MDRLFQQYRSKAAIQRFRIKLASSNSKVILIFTVCLPQFVVSGQPITAQFALLGWGAMCAYVYMGLHMRRWFAEPSGKRIFHRCRAGGGDGVADGASGLIIRTGGPPHQL